MSTDNPASEIAETKPDLVRRLRDMAAFQSAAWTGKVYCDLWRDAATEIESLTAQLAKCREALADVRNPAAYLRRKAATEGKVVNSLVLNPQYILSLIEDIARRALSTGERKGITPSTKVDSRGYHTSHKHLLYADQSEVTTLCRDCGLEGVYLCKPCKPALSTGEPK